MDMAATVWSVRSRTGTAIEVRPTVISSRAYATPVRRTRRSQRYRHGERIDLRRTLRGSLRTGGDPIHLRRRRRRILPRRLVVLCDISGSMEPYARAYLPVSRKLDGTVHSW